MIPKLKSFSKMNAESSSIAAQKVLDPGRIATNLIQHNDGYWVAKSHASIFYPSEGNDSCFAVEDGSFWFQHRNEVICELVKRFEPSGTIFDIGGGNGYVSRALQEKGFATVLVEPGADGAKNALKRGLDTVICATLEDCGFNPHSLPAAGMFDVLEHIEDDHEFLSMLAGLIAPGGRLYLTVPAYRNLWSFDDDYAGHFRRYSTSDLARALQSAGFEVEFTSYMFWPLPLPILLFRCLPTWLGQREKITQEITEREHLQNRGVLNRCLRHMLNIERNRIAKQKAIPFGSSCIAVARSRN